MHSALDRDSTEGDSVCTCNGIERGQVVGSVEKKGRSVTGMLRFIVSGFAGLVPKVATSPAPLGKQLVFTQLFVLLQFPSSTFQVLLQACNEAACKIRPTAQIIFFIYVDFR